MESTPKKNIFARFGAWFMGKKMWQRVLFVVVAILLVLVIAAGIVVAHLYTTVSEVFDTGTAGTLDVQEDPDILQNGERFYNLLLVGIDYDPTNVDGLHDYDNGLGNTDVIMYVQIDRDTGKINIFQIPRDTYAGETFSDGTKLDFGRINAAYACGPDTENHINNLANKVYELFKLPVDNYITIDMAAFKTLLNVQGGITMYVPWDIVDKDTGAVLVTQGTHAISGDTAEVILRNRNYDTADYQRLETQQYFYAAMVRTFLNDYKLADYYSACKNVAYYINTDLSMSEIWGLYGTLTTVKPSDIFIIRAPGGPIEKINGHTWVYGIHPEACAKILNTYFRDADMPVEADQLGLYKDFDFVQGVLVDEGKTLGGLAEGESPADAAAESAAADSEAAESSAATGSEAAESTASSAAQ